VPDALAIAIGDPSGWHSLSRVPSMGEDDPQIRRRIVHPDGNAFRLSQPARPESDPSQTRAEQCPTRAGMRRIGAGLATEVVPDPPGGFNPI
jgi:hypothetical protein